MANDYWEKRYERLLDESFQKANLTDDEIKANYARALRRIETAINDWYRRFATENGLQLAEARKLLNAYEMKAFKMDLAEFKAEAKKLVAEAGEQGLVLGADCTIPSDIAVERIQWVREALEN
nr:MAG TPA: minor capsid protein [Caudoviricetes sp.]